MRWRAGTFLRASALNQHQPLFDNNIMGKNIPRGFEKIRSGEHIQIPTFTNVAAAVAAGVTAAQFPRRIIHLSAGGTGSVPCLAISDGTTWTQVAIGINAI